MKRENYSSGAPWESIVGYSRAVRVGNTIEVAGTTAVIDGELVHPDDAGAQTLVILKIIEDAIIGLGGTLRDVVRTRVYVTDINDWEEVGKAHGTFFSDIRPASTLLEVSSLVNKEMKVEIEATAIISS